MTKYTQIKLAVDNCIFTVKDGELYVLLIQMKKKPYKDIWALPGGLVDKKERLETAAKRILKQQTAVGDLFLEQLFTFDNPKRDPFGRVISVAYYSLVPSTGFKLKTTTKYADVKWWKFRELPKQLAYDHREVASYAKKRLEWKIEYTNVVWSLLPEKFTLTELQRVYEAILGRELDKRNFRKKMLSLKLVGPTGKKLIGDAHRPAMLYKFLTKEPKIVSVL